MKKKLLIGMILSLAAVTNFGCGGGGGSSAPAAPQYTISGTVVDGHVNGAAINVFKLNDNGTPGEKVAGPVATSEVGTYTIPIGSHTGPALVVAEGGTFTDAATGTPGVSLATPLRAAVIITGDARVAVTLLTDLAYKDVVKEGAKTSPRALNIIINDSNALIGSLFNITDIIKTMPPDTDEPFPLTATEDERNYGLQLATLSQRLKVMKDLNPGKTMKDVLDEISSGIVNSGLTEDIKAKLQDASVQFNLNPNNKIVTPVTASKATLKLRTSGVLPVGSSIGGVEFTLALPEGVTVAADATTGQTTATSVITSGVTPSAAAGTLMLAKFTAAQAATPTTPASTAKVKAGVANAGGFGVGEFTTVVCDIAPGTKLTSASFIVTNSKAADFNGERITGVSTLFTVIFQ